MSVKRLVVGMSGASGAALGVMLLQAMQRVAGWETHLVLSQAAKLTINYETPYTQQDVEAMATVAYRAEAIDAAIASGSFKAEGMVVIPCSMKSLAGIAVGYSDTLLLRAADVALKERRPLVLVARESPLSALHLRNMLQVTELGGIIMPPVLAMYTNPASVEDLLQPVVARVLRVFGIELSGYLGWGETPPA